MAWLVKDGRDNTEWIYKNKPKKSINGFWFGYSDGIKLPKGSIKKLIGRNLTWEDDPVELKKL